MNGCSGSVAGAGNVSATLALEDKGGNMVVTGSHEVVVATSSVTTHMMQMSPRVQKSTLIKDSLDRAWRTFKVGLGLDIMVALALVVAPLATDVHWTKAWWVALGLLGAKTIVQTVASYVIRRWGKTAPKIGPQVTGR